MKDRFYHWLFGQPRGYTQGRLFDCFQANMQGPQSTYGQRTVILDW
jgi:hypothetical protein